MLRGKKHIITIKISENARHRIVLNDDGPDAHKTIDDVPQVQEPMVVAGLRSVQTD